jgi:hypothetical protein
MSIRKLLFGIAFVVASLGTAHADGVRPMEAKSVSLGGISGIAYYTVEQDGLHVITTLAQGETGIPFRVVSVLAPGQSILLSTQKMAGVIEIRRKGDSLFVRKTVAGSEAMLPTSNPTEGMGASAH